MVMQEETVRPEEKRPGESPYCGKWIETWPPDEGWKLVLRSTEKGEF